MSPKQGPGDDASGDERPPERTTAEWTVFAAAALLILAVVVVLAVDGLVGSSTPPAFRTVIQPVRAAEGGYQVPVEVENVGGQTGAQVRVAAELVIGTEKVEIDELVDFLAPGEKSVVTFVFEQDPATGELSVGVTAFKEP